MEPDELGNHIPWYPDRRSETYNSELLSKYEYSQHSATAPQQNAIYKNHQRLNQIHLGSQTQNRYLFIYKDPGVGKTCDAIGIAETRHEWLSQVLKTDVTSSMKRTYSNKAVVVAQNKASLSDNFKKDIMSTCTAGVYKTKTIMQGKFISSAGEQGSKTKSIQTAYELHTHEEFSNTLSSMDPLEITRRYSHRVIIIDEIHMYKAILRMVEDEDGNVGEPVATGSKIIYDNTMKLMDNIYGCVVVVLSATPVVNDINEFPSIINFALPREDRVNPDEFRNLVAGENRDLIRANLEKYLSPRLMGRVSRMKLSASKKKSIVRTNMDPNIRLMQFSTEELYLTEIAKDNDEFIDFTYALNYYAEAIRRDGGRSSDDQFHMNAIFASNMFWPNNYIGSDAFKLYLRETESGNKNAFTEAFLDDFKANIAISRAHLIENLRRKVQELETEKSAENVGTIEGMNANIQDLEERMKLHPDGKYEHTDYTDFETMLFTIKSKYSPVYASVLEIIMGIEFFDEETRKWRYIASPETNSIEGIHNRECAYFYNFYKDGGVIPLGLFLEMFGYERLVIQTAPRNSKKTGGNKVKEVSLVDSKGNITISKGKRYALLYSSKNMKEAKMRKILELANHPNNKYGEYLKVIGGTDVSAQGINFRNVRQAHFTSRKWNEAGNFQAEGRVDRTNSHKEFEDGPDSSLIYNGIPYGQAMVNGKLTQKYVKIFRHVAYFKDLNVVKQEGTVTNLSIGLKMYDDAAFKELKNKIPTDIMDRIAYDKLLNVEPGDTIPTNLIGYADQQLPVDYITYNIFHSSKDLEAIKCRIRGHFKLYFILTLAQIVKLCDGYHHSTIIKALTEMINDNERLLDRHGMINYLRESGDRFFLQKMLRSAVTISDPWMAYYSVHNFVRDESNIDSLSNELDYKTIEIAIAELSKFSKNDVNAIKSILGRLPLKSKAYLAENLIQHSKYLTQKLKLSPEVIDIIFAMLEDDMFYFQANQIVIHTIEIRVRHSSVSGKRQYSKTIPLNSRGELRIFSIREGKWRNSNLIEDATFIPLINAKIDNKTFEYLMRFDFVGRSSIVEGSHYFAIVDKENILSSRKTVTKSGKPSNKGAKLEGRANYDKDTWMWYLYKIPVDMYVIAEIYKNSANSLVRPIQLIRLRVDPLGEYPSPTVEGVRLSPYVDRDGHQLVIPVDRKVDGLVLIAKVVLHYTKAYPEILPWVFDENISTMDPALFTDERFFPRKGKKIYTIVPRERYLSVLDIVPYQLQASMIQKINSSLNEIYDMLIAGTANIERTDYVNTYVTHTPRYPLTHNLPIGLRFHNIYGSLGSVDLIIMLYILHVARGSIIYYF